MISQFLGKYIMMSEFVEKKYGIVEGHNLKVSAFDPKPHFTAGRLKR